MTTDIEEIKNDLKVILSEKRYNHSLGVMERANELAYIYNVDPLIAKLVGLTHDIAKDMTKDESFKYAKEHGIELDDIEKSQPYLLHGKIGAVMVKERYNFTDEMCRAIEFHTLGDESMDTLAKIIFVADKTDMSRDFDNRDYIIDLSSKDLNKAIVYLIDISLRKTMDRGLFIHPQSILTRNFMLASYED